MPHVHGFEVLLLVAIVIGSFFISWDSPAAKQEARPEHSPDQQPAVR